ncbi:Fe-S oxidoreductase [Aedoeadaptatus ivorii]|uniref:Fe-S oxidoreductase n=1 Tax=Aedoeadaptatus ivorii TaxID=54006 RepID=A0A448V1Z1_9FIRM|nr:(Fe-S)-binding protein [Peptoniphilus ivorii]MDQ0508118.1 Fe-S oxidoreductase [Peptoniphilus ivorii]VEJ35849.1 Fe-S oxidoreductase [Peptoniphilus ivorii]
MIEYAKRECIHCKRCTKLCPFLSHYEIDLSEFAGREELAGECYLCDNCKRACPKDISGREISMEFRKASPLPHRLVRFQKDPYLFRNLQKNNTKDLLFLGCNYPGVFPMTVRKLVEICAERGVDFSVDCCRKPIADTGYPLSTDSMFQNLRDRGIERLICCCPNCYNTLQGRSEIEVISIYRYLDEEGLLTPIGREGLPVYIPCGDREHRDFYAAIEPYLTAPRFPYESLHCCGLGGGAAKRNAAVANAVRENFIARNREVEEIWTYCASCAIAFQGYGLEHIVNFLSVFLGVDESPSPRYFKNVISMKGVSHASLR